MTIKKIAVTTGGGDAPGLNAVIRSVTLAAINRGWEVVGVEDGFEGLLHPEQYASGGVIPLTRDRVRGISHKGGTMLGTTNRGNPFNHQRVDEDGNTVKIDLSDRLMEQFAKHQIDALVTIGGDGTQAIAHKISQKGMNVVGVPKTIDNDLPNTIATFGFDTAVAFATECLGRLHTTAASHDRVMVVEVMGRHAGWIALHAGVAGSADVILIPEIPFDINEVARKVIERNRYGRTFSIVIVAEGAMPAGGTLSYESKGDVKRLGGVGSLVTEQLRELVPNEVRSVVLGHLLRGGTPSARDRLLATRFGAAAVRALDAGQFNVMVALNPPNVDLVPLAECTRFIKTVPVDGDTIATARDIGIEFGDSVARLE